MEHNLELEKRFGFKEANETDYWLLLLHTTACLTKDRYAPLNADIAPHTIINSPFSIIHSPLTDDPVLIKTLEKVICFSICKDRNQQEILTYR